MQKTETKKKAAARATAKPTPGQIAWNMPIGVALNAFYHNASHKDIRLAKKMYGALAKTMDVPPAGAKTCHFVMAAVNLARVAILAHAEQCQRGEPATQRVPVMSRGALKSSLQTPTDNKEIFGLTAADLTYKPVQDASGKIASLFRQPARRPPMKIAPCTLSHDQLSRIMDLLEKDQSMRDLHEVVTILSSTGIREGELRRLRWADVDFHGHKLVIVDSKGSSVRSVPLRPQTIQILEMRREREPAAEYVLGKAPRGFLDRVSRQFRSVCDGIGVSGVTLHLLRRTFLANLTST
jgi:hypothetical protein